jgi:23S rRNA-/tRNA-specific pseudouridylate synthase
VEKIAARGPYTLLGCTLETGRTHQIRVHLASQGLPILGDTLYDGNSASRLYLHAAHLAFSLNDKKYDVSAPLNL